MIVSAVLLAGGKSERMGRAKTTLVFRGEPFWKIQLELLHKLQPYELFVSARTDPAWRPADVQFVPDDRPSRGPLSGIAASLKRISTEHLLVLAIDMLFMTDAYLRDLCLRVKEQVGIVPMIGGRAEPLAAIYPSNACAEFAKALRGNDFSLQSVVQKLIENGQIRPTEVLPGQARLFRNLNEPSDLDRS